MSVRLVLESANTAKRKRAELTDEVADGLVVGSWHFA